MSLAKYIRITIFRTFFDDTISRLRLAALENGWFKSVSDLEMINIWAADLPGVTPAALIFHISRCGSTLISQMLTTVDRHIVLAEVPVFDQILLLQLNQACFSEDSNSALLSAALKFYGQNKGDATPSHLFIKTDSWHLFFYEQLRRLYPDTPFIIVLSQPRRCLPLST